MAVYGYRFKLNSQIVYFLTVDRILCHPISFRSSETFYSLDLLYIWPLILLVTECYICSEVCNEQHKSISGIFDGYKRGNFPMGATGQCSRPSQQPGCLWLIFKTEI